MHVLTTGLGMLLGNAISFVTQRADERSARSDRDTQRVTQLADRTGLPFFLCEQGRPSAMSTSERVPPFVPNSLTEELSTLVSPKVWEPQAGLTFYAIPLLGPGRQRAVAVGYVPEADHRESSDSDAPAKHPPTDLVIAAAEAGWTERQVETFWRNLKPIPAAIVERLITLIAEQMNSADMRDRLEQELDSVTTQLDHTYEEISLLHDVSRNLQVSQGPGSLAELCVRRLHALVDAGGTIIWVREKSGRTFHHTRGVLPFDPRQLERFVEFFSDVDWSRPLVRNHLSRTLMGADFPKLENFILVPIQEGMHRSGWVFCCNRTRGREFGSVEAGFMNSVATMLGTHVRNTELYQQNQDLLIGFVRSLVSSLDAKDPYTRGHSERVALIARRIGRQINLPESDLKNIYLSGLLHDVGKIGIDDRILRKPGRLTEAEFDAIKLHPTIGYNILKGLKNLQQILPGVRNHHENFDGSGYPDGLAGDAIPLMARILAVADGYDAMGSDRPYRKGMPTEKIEQIFREGHGTQWDPEIIDAYFACREDVLKICDTYSLETGAPLDESFSSSVRI